MKDLAQKFGISSPYGNRAGGFHYGVDIPTPMRQELYSPEDGLISFEGDIPAPVAGYPKDRIIILQMADSFIVFAHLDETVIDTGQRVKKGQLLGYTGNSGYSTGPHLHAEEHQGQKDPRKGFLAYPSIDITPRFTGQAQGGADDVTKLESFRRTFITQAQRWPNADEERAWEQSGMEDYTWVQRHGHNPLLEWKNQLQAQVDKLTSQTEQMTITLDKMEAQLTAAENRADTAEQNHKDAEAEVQQQARTIDQMTKTINRQKEEMAGAAKTIEQLKDAAKNSDAVSALSPLELIRIAINRWLGGD